MGVDGPQPLYSVRAGTDKPKPHYSVIALRLAHVVKILQEGRSAAYELPDSEARDACLVRAIQELHKALTTEVRIGNHPNRPEGISEA